MYSVRPAAIYHPPPSPSPFRLYTLHCLHQQEPQQLLAQYKVKCTAVVCCMSDSFCNPPAISPDRPLTDPTLILPFPVSCRHGSVGVLAAALQPSTPQCSSATRAGVLAEGGHSF